MAAELLWSTYHDSYRKFQQAAAQLRKTYDPAEAEAALLSVEQARLAYNDARDNLAAFLMPAKTRQVFWSIPAATRQETLRVKNIAELFWVMAGRPHGTAEDDWYRAERVVRHAVEEVCCR